MSTPRHRMAISALGAALLAQNASAAVGPWQETAEAKARLLSPWAVATAGGPLWLALELRLAPGWHVYWKNSGDAGYAPKLDFSGTPEVAAAELQFPAPRRFELPGGLVAFGYEDSVIQPVWTRLSPAEGESLHICAALDFLVCREECVPRRVALTLVQPLGSPPIEDPETAATIEEWRRRLPRPLAAVPGAPEVEVSTRRAAADRFEVDLDFRGGTLRTRDPDLFFETSDAFSIGRPQLFLRRDGFRFRVPVRPLDETKPLPRSALLRWTATGFTGPDGALALEGDAVAPLPAAPPRWLWYAAALAALALAVVLRRRHRATHAAALAHSAT